MTDKTTKKCPVIDNFCTYYSYYDDDQYEGFCHCSHSDNPEPYEGNCIPDLCPRFSTTGEISESLYQPLEISPPEVQAYTKSYRSSWYYKCPFCNKEKYIGYNFDYVKERTFRCKSTEHLITVLFSRKEESKSLYQPLEISLRRIAGIEEAISDMRLPKESEGDSWVEIGYPEDEFILGPKDRRLARSLVLAGPDHSKFTRGIIVWLRLSVQAGFMVEFETYRIGVETLSTTSSMHNELKSLSGPELAEKKQKDLPFKVYTRGLTISYQALRAMYRARRSHRHPDWKIFCDFIETLPYFKILIYPEAKS